MSQEGVARALIGKSLVNTVQNVIVDRYLVTAYCQDAQLQVKCGSRR